MNTKNTIWFLIAIVIIVTVFYVGFKMGNKKLGGKEIETPVKKTAKETSPAINITSENIKEENFSGKKPIISGSNPLVFESRKYIETIIADFKTQADADVPDMRKKFGADFASANYTIDIEAKYIKSKKTESIVISVYTYTGGAHGSTFYQIFNASILSGKILSLIDVIKKDKQNTFTELVKKELINWKPEKNYPSPVFPDEVKALTFDSFTNWSLDEKNLNIYFDQYEIGPGVLGAVTFPMSIEKVKDLLEPAFL